MPEPSEADRFDVWYWPAKGSWRPTVPGHQALGKKEAETTAAILRSLGNEVEIRPTTKKRR